MQSSGTGGSIGIMSTGSTSPPSPDDTPASSSSEPPPAPELGPASPPAPPPPVPELGPPTPPAPPASPLDIASSSPLHAAHSASTHTEMAIFMSLLSPCGHAAVYSFRGQQTIRSDPSKGADMPEANVELVREGAIATLKFSNPPRHTLTATMVGAMHEKLDELAQHKGVR